MSLVQKLKENPAIGQSLSRVFPDAATYSPHNGTINKGDDNASKEGFAAGGRVQ
jgi:hypothetical protein